MKNKPKCSGINKKGNRCGCYVSDEDGRCRLHKEKKEEESIL